MVAADLNYRLNLSDEDIRALLSPVPSDVNMSLLLQSDQVGFARSDHFMCHIPIHIIPA